MLLTDPIYIAEMLKANISLQVLWMGANPIGDDGIVTIASVLHKGRISELNIMECNITVTGAQSLAAGLLLNNNITY